jgi:hypothetical protein
MAMALIKNNQRNGVKMAAKWRKSARNESENGEAKIMKIMATAWRK